MKREHRVKLIVVFALAIVCRQSAHAYQASGSQTKTVKSVGRFVQDFYDWYAPKAEGDTPGPAWDLALKLKPAAFEPKLLRALREDSAAEAKAEGDMVGLEFDPFLDGQDPQGRYVVEKIRRRGQNYFVTVHSKAKSFAVVAQLKQHEGGWRFSNFLYSSDQDLLSILKSLKKDRIQLCMK